MLRDQRLQIDWLARGRYSVALWPRSVHVAEYQEAGSPIIEISVKEGSYVSSNGGNLVLLKNAPHPNAARIFINWYLSKEGQAIMQRVLKQQSSRADISTEGLDPIGIRLPRNSRNIHEPDMKDVATISSPDTNYLTRYRISREALGIRKPGEKYLTRTSRNQRDF